MSQALPDYDGSETRRRSGSGQEYRNGNAHGRMEFRILGPLEVRSERGVLALGGVKPRAVLAVLLLHANEPVSADRLALALWGEEASAGAVKTVQVHMSRLRKALGDGDIVTTTAAGYRLRVRPGELDAERFERLAEEGRRALATGQVEQSATILREALSLWRGPPLAELSFEPFAQTEIARLEEQRLAALEARVDAELAAGWHVPLVSELQQLVAENPTHERFAGQLMLALYRSGRQTDALNVYSRTRKALVTEIGMEPGPDLRDLQEAILRHDEALLHADAVGDGDSPAREPPRQLDTANSHPLISRTTELAWLNERWDRAQRGAGAVVAILGPAGSGKTRCELARRG
jgi:DNA-binding SARP family transcriptional activator